MPKLFKSPTAKMLEQRFKLSQYWNDDATVNQIRVPFNLVDPNHITLVKDCTETLNEKLAAIQAIDKKIVGAFALGFGSLVASCFLPLSILAFTTIAAFTTAAYLMSKRQTAYAELTYARENLEACCGWSVGKVAPEMDNEFKGNEHIKNMMDALAPVMLKEQMKDIIEDRIEDALIDGAEQNFDSSVRNNPLMQGFSSADQKTLIHNLYAKDQGSYFYIFQAAALIVQTAYKSASGLFKPAEHSIEEAPRAAA
jgi:hypothetical protein